MSSPERSRRAGARDAHRRRGSRRIARAGAAGLSRGLSLRILATMRLSREWDLRWESLLRTGGVGKWYSSVGNEALTVAAATSLRAGDGLLTLHRDVGALFAYRIDAQALLGDLVRGRAPERAAAEARRYLVRLACQMLGKSGGFTGGFDRSYHFGELDPERGVIHIGMISHLGAMVPVAAGVALAQRCRAEGAGAAEAAVTLNFLGDGGASTGDFHEGLNLAAVWKLPLVLVIENNRYAFSTPEREQHAARRFSDRGVGYGIPAQTIDGNDPLAVRRAVGRAVRRARRGDGPTLIEARVGRLRGHAEGDGSLDVVPAEELELYRREDPVPRFERQLIDAGVITAAQVEALAGRLRGEIEGAIETARAAADPTPAALETRSVFAAAGELSGEPAPIGTTPTPAADGGAAAGSGAGAGATYLEAIRRGLAEEMRRDDAVLLLGQDIGRLGGAFRVTEGLLAEFGARRVRNTPIAESGTIGAAVGAALLGLRPVVEMQFADFIACGFNQVVNVAAKMYFRWGASVPIVIRCPCGGGGAVGPFHSQNPEAWFAHVPGLKIVAPAFPFDALGLLRAAIRDPNPVIFLEHKQLYRRVRAPLPDGEILVPIGAARTVRRGRDATVIAYGWMVHRALEAAGALEQEGIAVEVLDLRTLAPLDEATILESLERTSRALVVHEANRTCGLGAEVAARIADAGFDLLDAPVKRVAYPDVPVPYQRDLESACLPDAGAIAAAVRELLRY